MRGHCPEPRPSLLTQSQAFVEKEHLPLTKVDKEQGQDEAGAVLGSCEVPL